MGRRGWDTPRRKIARPLGGYKAVGKARQPTALLSLPTEILLNVCSFLAPKDLASFARCYKSYNTLAAPCLHRDLLLTTQGGTLTPESQRLLCFLPFRPDFVGFIRHIRLHEVVPDVWFHGCASPVQNLLHNVMASADPRLVRSFAPELPHLSQNHRSGFFCSLQCTKVRSNSDVDWVQWHLQNCPHLRSAPVRVHILPGQALAGGRT